MRENLRKGRHGQGSEGENKGKCDNNACEKLCREASSLHINTALARLGTFPAVGNGKQCRERVPFQHY